MTIKEFADKYGITYSKAYEGTFFIDGKGRYYNGNWDETKLAKGVLESLERKIQKREREIYELRIASIRVRKALEEKEE